MWTIQRKDTDPCSGEVTYFEIQAAYCQTDLRPEVAWRSGFVGPNDRLAIISPTGKTQKEIARPSLDITGL